MKEISKYKVAWVEFRAKKGIVTKHDEDILLCNKARGNNSDRIFKHFPNKEAAMQCLMFQETHGWFKKLNKQYEVRICTDAQFGKGNVIFLNGKTRIEVKYTKMQEDEMFLVG